ncbi:hypothetical protein FNF27_06953 [Cafeteria roenbergensis]|uniref:NADH dehydrogenase [ubiquinone] 1 alpha subcomplex subunit 13 n=1 Tax=Cafeteria roenbergensis TaxID=33653 RepID=A0A5A8DV94_CAFRO|nr:hypothetical protein FNF29_06903 [Cafeteria roenbergensis]KAA0151157.1 hypothetical protein FNF31_06891 [Cafeteria roenbergensis]KAA0156999.1 hypothetical protein FNF28_06566 [Cafeteria roenbergensis]KAA0162215.1 hypothetical protein FNF27_08089 [Cafeteria roenbergensis]KAA0169405.1 hypothetical protein FNF27_06953 [Cafeteria roenbergensis]|eukprot:KAA0148108.1 hypothetical protein FNF29_06903 [Cafeteria roenbergensis]
MATVPPTRRQIIQEMPRKGGFPALNVQLKRTVRGPPSWALLAGTAAISIGGLLYYVRTTDERRYIELAKINERFERAYVLQAVEDVTAPRRNKALIDTERELMASDPKWVVNQSPYMTARPKAPAFDEMDPRLFDGAGSR